MLVTIENVLNDDELASVRALIARSTWESGRATAGTQAATVKNNEQIGASAEHLPALRRSVLDALTRNPLYFSAPLPLPSTETVLMADTEARSSVNTAYPRLP